MSRDKFTLGTRVKKRILQFIGSFHQGGSERQAIALTRRLKTDGTYNVFAATLNRDGVLRDDVEQIGLPEIPEFRLTSFYDANFFRQARRCAAYLKENKIDLVHTHDFYTNVFGMTAATLAGVPVRIASKRETSGMRSKAQEFVEKLAFRRSNVIVANSLAVRDYLIARSIADSKIKVIYNGLDLSRFENIDKDRAAICQKFGLRTDENARFVTSVANLRHPVKNVPMLLRAAKLVINNVPDAQFVIAGEGGLKGELCESAAALGVADKVHFIGRCTDVPELLGISYACVLTSSAEGFSNSILEYMAAGKPVVATNVGGAAEAIIEATSGHLVASNDDAAMAVHLTNLLNDEAKTVEFGAKGRKIIEENFSLDSQLKKTMELYGF